MAPGMNAKLPDFAVGMQRCLPLESVSGGLLTALVA